MRTAKLAAWGAALALATGTIAAATAGVGNAAGPARSGPIAKAKFTNPQQNSYFPLEPGTVFRYSGKDGGKKLTEKLTVTDKTKVIQGIRATVIRDVIRRTDGSLAEKTTDWYAPDNKGNVWYLGEKTATYKKDGTLESRDGTWLAGRDGAVAGLIMPAKPRPGKAYRQEFYPGQAEDQAWIVSNDESRTVAYGAVQNVVRSFEWTALEKGVVSVKFYGPGLGIIAEKDVSGGTENFQLVSVTRP